MRGERLVNSQRGCVHRGVDVRISGLVAKSFARAHEQLEPARAEAACVASDTERLHDLRVAVRRLRGELRVLRRTLDRDVSEPLRDELEWVGDELVVARDLDSLQTWFTSVAAQPDAPLLARAVALLDDARPAAQRQAVAALTDARFAALVDAVARYADEPPVGRKGATKVAKLAPRLMAPPCERLIAAGDAPPPSSESTEGLEHWHEVRKRARAARYAAELLASQASLAKAAKRFKVAQDLLGDYHDAWLAQQWLAGLRSEDAYELGQFAADAIRVRTETMAQWPSAWSRARNAAKRWT